MESTTITIDPARCEGDGLCAGVCPMRLFAHEAQQVPEVSGEQHCVLCGQCVAVCPHDAIRHGALDRRRFAAIAEMPEVDGEAVASVLRQRRSVRTYRRTPIPRAELEQITGIAAFSPCAAHGGEGWTRTCVVVSGEQAMGRVLELTAEYLRRLAEVLESVPVRVLARFRPGTRIGRSVLPDITMRLSRYEQGEDVITYGAPHALFFHGPRHSIEPQVTCDTALYTVMLLAHAKGIGSCWNGWLAKAANGFRVRSFTGLGELLGFPEHHQVFAAATLGYRGVKLHSTPDRRTAVRFVGDG